MLEKINRIYQKAIIRENIEKMFMIFFILVPMVDNYRHFFGENINILGIAIEEIFFTVGVLAMFLLVLLTQYESLPKARKRAYWAYAGIVAVYMGVHCLSILRVDQTLFAFMEQNVIIEVYGILRGYLMPIFLCIALYEFGLSTKAYEFIIRAVTWLTGGAVVLTNLLGISLRSYGSDKLVIEGNIFHWINLTKADTTDHYTSKAGFVSANTLSALMLSLLPMIIYLVLKYKKQTDMMLLVTNVLAMIMVGTRVASYGVILYVVLMAVGFLAIKLINGKNNAQVKMTYFVLKMMILVIAGTALLQIAPVSLRYKGKVELEERTTVDVEEMREIMLKQPDGLSKFLDKYSYFYFIDKEYLGNYPVSNDEAFWLEVMDRDTRLNADNREMKTDIVNRIIQRNDNTKDELLGLGITSNIVYMERDYLHQSILLGYLGLLVLVLPFPILLMYAFVAILRRFKVRATYENFALGVAVFTTLGVAYFSGHVIGVQMTMVFLSLNLAYLLNKIKRV